MVRRQPYNAERELEQPLAAQYKMGLIYVNPEGPNEPDALLAAH
jgi:catalase (peroxidase I)